ncbi:MAG: SurA N-terminal domain-containing protein [Candidatus Levybacteria bacterium]|nr:SurA N-terminal domain-containing protein [Candidatus Levybacteria bacterium]
MPVNKKAVTKSQIKNKKSETHIYSEIKENWTAKAIRNKIIIIPLAIIVIAGLLYYFRGLFIVAIVNGKPIDRISFTKELEKAAGAQILNQLVTKTLILQEAKKQNVSVRDDEISAEIKKIEDQLNTQGQKLDDALSAQAMTRKDLQDQIRTQKLVEKMIGKDAEVTDKEVEDYLAQNPDAANQNGSEEDKKRIKEQLKQQKIQEKFQTFIAKLQQDAKVLYFTDIK